MKMNIEQLIKANKRIQHAGRRALKLLTDNRPHRRLTAAAASYSREVLVNCLKANKELKAELLSRRIGLPGVRDARPLKQQRLWTGRVMFSVGE